MFTARRALSERQSRALDSFRANRLGGRTGYTNDIHISYKNHSSLTEYVCGNADLPDSPILWSNNSRDR